MEHPFSDVLVVGAGPAGLLLSLLLSKHGISTHILEAADHLDPRPRAAVYGPPAIPDLRRAGILDRVREEGTTLRRMTWRRPEDHRTIAGYDGGVLEDVGGENLGLACMGLPELSQVILDAYVDDHGGGVSWNHKVVGAGQEKEKAWVDVETPGGVKRMWTDYVVGCDGAHGQVRRSMGADFPGFTWDDQIVATNTYFDFEKHGFDDINFIVHPKDFYMACKLDNSGLYRVTYGEDPGLTPLEMRANLDRKFHSMLPGHPSPSEYTVVNFAPYRMHQRCAPTFRLGRLLLAADAAHLCNPWGGMGITGGFVDVGGLYECLAGYYDGKADESILDRYSEIRRRKWRDVTDPVSQANFRRVGDSDAGTLLERDGFLARCGDLEGDVEGTREMLMGSFDLRYDFTQHYRGRGEVAKTGRDRGVDKSGRERAKIEAKTMKKGETKGDTFDVPKSTEVSA